MASTLLNAATFTVSNTDDSGPGSLREAIAAANTAAANDSVVDASNVSGTIQLQDSLAITAPMEIKGPGAQDLIISGDKNGNSQQDAGDKRPIFVDSNGGGVQIRGATISGGYALLGIGGGIFNRSGILTIEDCIITDNFSDQGTGGGIASWTELNIISSTISNNTASDAGGGIYISGFPNPANCTISNSTISNNTSGNGGGIYHSSGTLTITGSTFSGNASTSEGGGLYSRIGTATLSNTTLNNNTAAGLGGGIYSFASTLNLDDPGISNNTAGDTGGGIHSSSSTVTITRGTIDSNSGNTQGGGIFSESGSLSLVDSTVGNNTATNGEGGGIYNSTNSQLTITGSVIQDNQVPSGLAPGGGIYTNGAGGNLINSIVSGNHADGSGGGVYVGVAQNASIQITDSTISQNSTTQFGGGGIRNDGTVTILRTIISDNSAGLLGGGIENVGTLFVDDSTISGNGSPSNAFGGGGLFNVGQADFTNTIFLNNTSGAYGGAIYQFSQGSLTLSQSTVSGSTAQSSGGGIFTEGPIDILDSMISGNIAGTHGGGIYQQPGVVITLTDTTIDSNTAQTGNGGGLFTSGNVDILNSTVSNNTASTQGAGLFNEGEALIQNSTISGNTPLPGNTLVGGGIFNTEDGNNAGGILEIRNSTVTNNTATQEGGGLWNNSQTGLIVFNTIIAGNTAGEADGQAPVSESNNLIGIPQGSGIQDILNPSLADNGGPTLSHTLAPGSPGLDAGSNAESPLFPFDQRGQGFDRIVAGTVDIGSFEIQDQIPPTVVINQVPTQNDPTSVPEVQFLAIFNEPVSGFSSNDLAISGNSGAQGANVVEIAPQDGTTFRIDISGLTQGGILTVEIPAGGVSDNSGNPNNASTSTDNSVTFNPFLVQNTQDAGDLSLRQAIMNGNNFGGNPTINATDVGGTIILQDTLVIQVDMLINGPGSGGLSVSGDSDQNGQADPADITPFLLDTPGTATIRGLTIEGGNADQSDGGGIFNRGNLTLDEVTVRNNQASRDGGGIFNDGGTINISNSTLSGNFGQDGGGLFNDSGTVLISDSLIESNTATSGGGGISNADGTLTISNSNITGNQSAFDGGGIYNESGQLDVLNSTFTNNSSQLGGGIENYLGFVQIGGSTFTGNSAEYGGGVENFEASTLIQQSTFSGNTADFGGGVDNFLGDLRIEDSALSSNTAVFSGGGIFTEEAHLEVHQSTVSGNNADDGGGIGTFLSTGSVLSGTITQNNGGGIDQDSTTFLIRNTIVAGQQTGPDTTGNLAQNSLNNIIGIPQGLTLPDILDPLLMNNGGPTETHAIPQSSPAFNGGNNAFLDGQVFDQRGAGFDRIVGGTVDIGAFEQQNLNTPPTIDNIPNQVVTANFPFAPISFGINDAETPANQLSVTLSFLGGDQAIFNDLQISVLGSGAQRNLIFGGTTLLNGSFNMQVEVQDGKGGSAQDDLSVTVQNSSPTITINQSLTLFSRTQNQPESFQVQDIQTPGGQLSVIPSFIQGDQNLFNDLQIDVQGGGNQWNLIFGGTTPNTGTFTMDIKVFDTDGGFSSARLHVTVANGAPPNPIIANIDDQEFLLGLAPPRPVDVIFGDHQSKGNQLDMLVRSDNPSIFRSSNILIGRPGQDEFLRHPAVDQLVRDGLPLDHIQHQQIILPAPLRAGVAKITITVRDEDQFESKQAFSVVVFSGNFLIVDDGDPGFSTMGSWEPSGAAGAFQGDSLISFESGSKATFSPSFTEPGTYGVYVHWVNRNPNDNSLFERDPSVQVTVNHANGTSVSSINQQQNGERFNLIGIFDFAGNSMGNVCLSKISNINGPASADAVRFVPFQPAMDPGAGDDLIVDIADSGFASIGNWMPSNAVDAYNGNSLFNTAQGATATFTPNILEAGKYEAYVHHSSVLGNGNVLLRDPNASYTVNHANGSSQTFVNQNFRPNDWLFLGAFDFEQGTQSSIFLERTTIDISAPTVADAVRLVRIQAVQEPKLIVDNMDPGFSTVGGWAESNAPDTYDRSAKTAFNSGDQASWTPSFTEPGTYDVYAWWSNQIGSLGLQAARRDSTSWYEITHSGGVSNQPINQNLDNGRWNYLGTFDFSADGTAKVVLNHGIIGGTGISADAIQFIKNTP